MELNPFSGIESFSIVNLTIKSMKTILLIVLFLLFTIPRIEAQTLPFQFTHKGSILHVKFSPSGAKLLSYSSGNQDMCMWDVSTGRVIWKRPISFIQKADEYYTLDSIAWSPDERLVATGSANGTVQLWKSETGEFLWIADVTKTGVAAIAFNPNGETLAAVPYSDKAVAARLLDVATGKSIRTYSGDECEHIAATITQDGTELRIGDLHADVARWSFSSGRLLSASDTTCRSHYSYGGERSYSSELSLSVRRTTADKAVIEETNGKIIEETKLVDSKLWSAINARAKVAIIGEYGGYRLYDLSSGTERVLNDCTSGSAFDISPDGQTFAQSCDGFKTVIKLTNLVTGKVSLFDGHPSNIHAISYSPDHSLIAAAGNDGNAYLFDPESKRLIKTLAGDGNRLTALAFRPDGKSLLTGDDNGTIHEWNLISGTRSKNVKPNDRSDDVERIETSKDSKSVLVFMHQELMVLNGDLSFRSFLTTPEGYSSTSGEMTITYSSVPVSGASFIDGGSTIITGHSDGSIRVWDTTSGRQTKKIGVADGIRSVAGIPTRTAVASVVDEKDKTRLLVISPKDGKILSRTVQFDGSYAEKLMVSPDGQFAAVTDISGDTFIVDLNTMQIRELNHLSGSDSVAFNSDSKTFFIGGENQNIELYDTVSLKKLWQLIPDFEPSSAELKLENDRRSRNQVLADIESKRDKQAAIDVEKYSKLIAVSFLHFGDMSDPGEKRMLEPDMVNESRGVVSRNRANAAWFRLKNNSPLPINIPTESMYLPDPKCFYQFLDGQKIFGSCGEREVGIWFGVKDNNGKWVPYGFDFGSSVNLLPGSSVIFPVPLTLINKDYRIVFDYSFQNVRASENDREWNYGHKVELSIDSKLLPR
jgi:WD40 repeat protein